jgi:glyoxylase-like metal-dependent hydrolase (beta-lactamase superfamily II)
MRVAEDIVQVRAPFVLTHVIREGDDLYLIDSGFVGGMGYLRRELVRARWSGLRLRGILLTHGHLDHTLNLSRLHRESGAWVAVPKADAAHVEGSYPYRGLARTCGALEWIGRKLLRYKVCPPDRWIEDGDEFPLLGGLKAVHLPGHTRGHVGFYSATRRLLFSGDLFANYGLFAHLPPRFLNTSQPDLHRSVRKALALDLDGVLPNHGAALSPADHLQQLRALARDGRDRCWTFGRRRGSASLPSSVQDG